MTTRQSEIRWDTVQVDMPDMGPGSDRAGWWASFLLELADHHQYDTLLQYLSIARKTESINHIRLASEMVIRARMKARQTLTRVPPIRKARHRSVSGFPKVETKEVA